MIVYLSFDFLVEKKISVISWHPPLLDRTVITVVPFPISFYVWCIMSKRQCAVMVHHSYQLVLFSVYHFFRFQLNWSFHLFSIYHISIALVIEPLQMQDQNLWQFVNRHYFLCKFVVLTFITVPCIVCG